MLEKLKDNDERLKRYFPLLLNIMITNRKEGLSMIEYVTYGEVVYCERCGCPIEAGTPIDTSYPLCSGCECNSK